MILKLLETLSTVIGFAYDNRATFHALDFRGFQKKVSSVDICHDFLHIFNSLIFDVKATKTTIFVRKTVNYTVTQNTKCPSLLPTAILQDLARFLHESCKITHHVVRSC